MKALLIIDVQNDFLSHGALEVPAGQEIITIINGIQPLFEIVVATQDWHPPHHISFASQHPGKNPFDVIQIAGIEQTLWPDHCVQETNGAQLASELNTAHIEAIIRKGTNTQIDSYSAFFDNHHQKSTGLNGYLKERQVSELYLCGLAADVCVYYSLLDARHAGLQVALIEDATMAIDPAVRVRQQEELREQGVRFVSSQQLLQGRFPLFPRM